MSQNKVWKKHSHCHSHIVKTPFSRFEPEDVKQEGKKEMEVKRSRGRRG